MATRVTRVGNLDIQFQTNWEMAKGNQLVQSLQQTISAVNSAWQAIAVLQAAGGGGGGGVTSPVQIADGSGIGPHVAVGPGLSPGDVLIAISGTDAAFGQLQFGEMAQTDSASFNAPAEGDVIMFHTGFWTAMPDPNTGLGLADPGQNALVMWDETAAAFAWAIPVAGGGIKLVAGAISIDDTQIDHAKLEGLHFTVASGGTTVANDHPQYAMLAAANTWVLQQTFSAGLISNADIILNGNLEQSGAEPEWRIVNTDDIANEGAWRIHAEPGQFIISSVSDDGADGENWLCATRIGETVDAVNVSSNSFTWNGAQVVTTDYVPPLQSNPTFISPITVPQGITLTGVEPAFTMGDTQSAADEGYWQLHAEPGQLIFSTLADDGISWGENWLTVSRNAELVESINLQADSLTFNGDTVLTSALLGAGKNVYLSTNSAGQTLINTAAGGGGGSLTLTDGTNTVAGTTQITVTGATVGGATPNATLTISGGSTALPGTIPDLMLWWESDNILGAAGKTISRLQERTPWVTGVLAYQNNISPQVISGVTINSLPTMLFQSSAGTGGFPLVNAIKINGAATVFVVVDPANSATGQAIFGGAVNCLACYLCTAASPKVNITNGSTAVIGTSTVAWTAGVPFQFNATYTASTGAWAIRQARAAAGSGTGSSNAGTATTQWIGADAAIGTSNLVGASLALLIIYNRALSPTEIANVEAYILSKWGV